MISEASGGASISESYRLLLRSTIFAVSLPILEGGRTQIFSGVWESLRRRLLIDSHFPKDENKAPDLVMDNPLSQNPDSLWGRFFCNAELEKVVDQDLCRLYPEHGSFFQTMACQAMLRRILLLWCLRHPEYGYGQGMHELLAPLLYVLHVDVQRLSQVRELYEGHFTDKFDETSYPQSNQASTHKLKRTSSSTSTSWSTGNDDDESNLHGSVTRVSTLDELDPDIRKIYLLTDTYGAEGELGILLSEKFMEHDAYCMFDGEWVGLVVLWPWQIFFPHHQLLDPSQVCVL